MRFGEFGKVDAARLLHVEAPDVVVVEEAAVIVPVLANGVRAFATIWVADLTSVETAGGFDHIVYGWVWFGVVMAATLAIGWRGEGRPVTMKGM